MRSTISIGERDVEMAANAASPFIYHKIFGEDFLLKTQDGSGDIELYIKMAFVMAKQAEIGEADMMKGKVTETDFIQWLAEFENMDMINALPEILNVYMKQKKTSSVPKK